MTATKSPDRIGPAPRSANLAPGAKLRRVDQQTTAKPEKRHYSGCAKGIVDGRVEQKGNDGKQRRGPEPPIQRLVSGCWAPEADASHGDKPYNEGGQCCSRGPTPFEPELNPVIVSVIYVSRQKLKPVLEVGIHLHKCTVARSNR